MRVRNVILLVMVLTALPAVAFCLTLDDVVRLKDLGIDEAVIIQKINESGVTFVLGNADLTRLKKAGASDALIEAMRASKATKTPVKNIIFIFDCSGSMMEKTPDGKQKITVARQAFADLANKLSSDLEVGVVAFGHQGSPAKDGIEVLRKLRPFDKVEVVLSIAKLVPKGKTPIAASLLVAAGQLTDKTGAGSIVLISDGKETAGGNPVETAAVLRQKHGIQFGIHVVGFAVGDDESKQLAAIAASGGGRYFQAKDARELGKTFAQIAEEIAEPARKAKAFFADDFDRDKLGPDYEVKNENKDAYLVGDPKGYLLVLTKPGGMDGPRKKVDTDIHKGITNLIILKKDLPKGDWRVTVRLRAKITSYNQGAGFLLYQDNDNWLSVFYWCPKWDGWTGLLLHAQYNKELKGQLKSIRVGPRNRVREPAKAKAKTVQLRLEKHGRKYASFYLYEGKDKAFKPLGTHTVLRMPGRIALAAYNADPKANEIAVEFDWLKIEALE